MPPEKQINRESRRCRPPLLAGGSLSVWLGIIVLLSLGGPIATASEESVSKEYQVKAAFLYNFTKFVEWPEQRFEDAKSPIIVGVLGKTSIRNELEKIVQGRKVNGREILVKAEEAPAPDSVHVLFVGVGEEAHIAGTLKAYESASVLTVGESAQFAAAGGIVTFTHEADKIRFEINISEAEKSRLKISSQLQKLATVVHR